MWAGAYLRWSGGRWRSVPVTRGPAGNEIVDGIAAVPGSATVWGFGKDSDHSFIAEYQA